LRSAYREERTTHVAHVVVGMVKTFKRRWLTQSPTSEEEGNKEKNMQLESTLIGHKFRCFDVRLSKGASADAPLLLLTASEDGTAKLWDIQKHTCLFTFKHNTECEVLRVAFLNSDGTCVITCGADGKAIVWGYKDSQSGRRKYEPVCSLDHGDAQIYVCEVTGTAEFSPSITVPPFVSGAASSDESAKQTECTGKPMPLLGERTFLLTAADDRLYTWDLSSTATALPRVWTFISAANGGLSHAKEQDTSESGENGGNSATSYGGPRNAENTAYIFDAKSSPKDPHKVAVALSDGSIRILNTRCSTEPNAAVDTEAALDIRTIISQLKLKEINDGSASLSQEGIQSEGVQCADSAPEEETPSPHATGVSWSADSRNLLVALGDGGILVLDVNGNVYTGRAFLCGHSRGCFGVTCMTVHPSDDASESGVKRKFTDQEQQSSRALSWSSDGTICEWNLLDCGVIREPIQRIQIHKYPIYSCALSAHDVHAEGALIACAGGEGGSTGGFLGTPVHVVRYN